MRHSLLVIGITLFALVSSIVSYGKVSAGAVTVSETCNVAVTFKAIVPDSIEQGKSFTVSGISVSPSNSYGFTVTSSVFNMTATNTSSTAYSQNSYATSPSPTTNHNVYVAYYPNWSLDATGPVGSSVTINLKKTLTVIQGYGGSPVTCNFTKVLATIPIVAPTTTPAPSTAPSAPSSPSPPTASTPSSPATSSSSSGAVSPSVATTSQQPTIPSSDESRTAKVTALVGSEIDSSPSVVPLNVEIKDISGKRLVGAVVTLDNAKQLTTDSIGRVTFSNVLTGKHVILVSYKGQKMSKDIKLTTADVGGVIAIDLPAPPLYQNPIAIAGVSVATIGTASTLGIFAVRRRRRTHSVGQSNDSDVTLHSIISGTAVQATPNATIAHIPAVPVFPIQPLQPSPAPWTPAAATEISAQAASFQPPVQPIQTQPNAPSAIPDPVQPDAPQVAPELILPTTKYPPIDEIAPTAPQLETSPPIAISKF